MRSNWATWAAGVMIVLQTAAPAGADQTQASGQTDGTAACCPAQPAADGGARKAAARRGPLTPDRVPAHPFMLFSEADIPQIAQRKDRDEMLAGWWNRLLEQADAPDRTDRPAGDSARWWGALEARALVARLTGEPARIEKAIAYMQEVLERYDPNAFYERGADNFHVHGAPLRALGLAWDWLYTDMSARQRAAILPKLENWCDACMKHTDKQWWREASYNVGAIPIGGLGTLALAILADSKHPDALMWYREASRRIGQNFFPTSWRPSGICYEGPNYAIVGYKYPAVFAEALRRAGGPDFLSTSGARHAMQYLMYQWLPQEGCAPIGDNTTYGRRTFAAEYLLGVGMTNDQAGLWTWRTYADQRYMDVLIAYLWYPLDVQPVSPAEKGLSPTRYFEVAKDRAGYLFSRTRWDDPDAAFFAFVTRYDRCNHQHFDMNSFLLGGFGELFATHKLLFPYGHEHHGADMEHNMVIYDEGGWPAEDTDSCGDSGSTEGVMVGLAMGPFGDYIRGDAKWAYRDSSIITSDPSIRADRAALFVKAGATPYMVVLDDIHYREVDHDYHWQWYAPDAPISGKATTAEPLVIEGKKGSCAIHFVTPASPRIRTEVATSDHRMYRQGDLQRIVVTQRGQRVQFAAIATMQASGSDRPAVEAIQVDCPSEAAGAARVKLADGSIDVVAWQGEEDCLQRGLPLTAGQMETDGLAAMVRVKGGQVVGYMLGEGTYLKWGEQVLVEASDSVCVSADDSGPKVFGRQRSREGLAAVEPDDVQAMTPGATGEATAQR